MSAAAAPRAAAGALRIGALAAACAAALAAACAEPPPVPRHVLLVVLDATHGDQLSCQGGPPGLTPALDALAARGTRFDRAFSVAPWTLPATSSLLTGLLPEQHGATDDARALPPSAHTLAEAFAAAGWSTAGFVQMVYASDAYGLAQGFEHYRYYASAAEKQDGLLVADVLAHWRERDERPSLTYVHFRRPHGPYNPDLAGLAAVRWQGFPGDDARLAVVQNADWQVQHAAQLSAEELAAATALYRANLATVDASLGALLEDAGPDTLVVVLSDHGEAFGQHDAFGHGAHVWAETLDIPLLVAGPGVEARVDREPACTIDVLPTLLELCRVPPPTALPGHSLAARLRGPAPAAGREPIVVSARAAGDAAPALAVFDARWKLHLRADGGALLSDRLADRGETRDLSAEHAALAARLTDRARAFRARPPAAALPGATPELDAQRLAELRALGYVK